MHPTSIPAPQHLKVNNEYDVISLRQTVRQMARVAGLGLAQQARITAAISEIARVLLADMAEFTVRVSTHGPHPALEVIVRADCANPRAMDGETNHFTEARSLVDEALVDPSNTGSQLTLRMWLGCNPSPSARHLGSL